MSHRATNWLSELPPEAVTASEFRVLFLLCDCHNPSRGCYPSQEYLRTRADVSNGTVNNVLNSLEAKGLIQRHRSRDGKTKRQCPTRYILGFEIDETQDPSPKSGDGNAPEAAPAKTPSETKKTATKSRKPTPNFGDGAVSNFRAKPSPISGPTRLQPTGEEPVKNQERTSARDQRHRISSNPMVIAEAQRVASAVRAGRVEALTEAQPWVVSHIVAAGLLTDDEVTLAKAG